MNKIMRRVISCLVSLALMLSMSAKTTASTDWNVYPPAVEEYTLPQQEILDQEDTSSYEVVAQGENYAKTVQWYIYSNGLLEVTGTGTVSTIYASSYYNSVTRILVRSSITGISDGAFSNFSNVREITLPFVGASRTSTAIPSINLGCIWGYRTSTSSISGYQFDIDGTYYRFNVPSTLKTVNITDATQIGAYAFYGYNIEKINLNRGITTIGEYAFYQNSSLKHFALPETVTSIGQNAFYQSGIKEIHIPDGMTEIAEYTFYGCSSLEKLTIGTNITEIGSNAFSGCSALQNIYIPDKVTSIGGSAFTNCSGATKLHLSNGLKSIGTSTFSGCSKIESIHIPDSVTTLGSYAFENCSSAKALYIGSGIKIISDNAFDGCSGLTKVVVPNTVSRIGKSAFAGCDHLAEISLPFVGTSRTATGPESAFGYIFGTVITNSASYSGCLIYKNISSNLDHSIDKYKSDRSYVFVDSRVEYTSDYRTYSWYSCYDSWSYTYDTDKYYLRTYYFNIPATLKNVIITDETDIPDGAFNNCRNITSIQFNENLKSAENSFFGMTWLENNTDTFVIVGDGVLLKYNGSDSSVTIPENVKYIGGAAFWENTNLTSLTLHDGVIGIGSKAFAGCNNLTELTIPKSVASIGADAIPTTCKIKVYMPSAGYDYRASNREILNDSYTTGQDTFYYTVKENGNIAIIGCITTSTALTVPTKINGVIVDEIASYSFKGCTTLTSITIPNNITNIGEYAFQGCTGLINATIPTTVKNVGNYAFKDCTGLVNVTISEGVETIGEGVFYNCISLVEAVVPDTAKTVGAYAFYNCDSLATATIGITADAIGDYTFYGCEQLSNIVIGLNVSRIGDYAFYDCALTKITVPTTTTYIGKYAFYSNDPLTRVTLRKGIVEISDYAFAECAAMTNINLPSSIIAVGEHAFENCAALTSLTLPANLSSLGQYAFSGCVTIPKVTIPANITVINDSVFSGCTSLSSVTIQSPTTSIGAAAFFDCAFAEIVFPETLETIHPSAFQDCKNLTFVTIPDATTTIGEGAFANCTAMVSVSLPDSVSYMGKAAFTNNNELTATVRYHAGQIAAGLLEQQEVYCVIIDERITDIGDRVFACCYNLKTVTYGDHAVNSGEFLISPNVVSIGSEAFQDATLLKSLFVPDTIQTVGENAFYNSVESYNNCTDVKVTFYYVEGSIAANILKGQWVSYIYINDNIHTIGDSAFNSCGILKSVFIPDTISTCGSNVFAASNGKVVAYFRGVDGTLDANVYQNKTSGLDVLVFDESIDTIGKYAFAQTSATNVLIKDTDLIDEYAFSNSRLDYVTIQEVETVASYAFANNETVTVSIDTAGTIANRAFVNNTKLYTVEIGTVNTIGQYVVEEDGIANGTAGNINEIDPQSLYTVTIENAEIINDHAFANSRVNVAIIDKAETIGEYAFANLRLVTLEIGNADTIDDYAFYNDIYLDKVEIGSVKSIGDYAFSNGIAIKNITIERDLLSIGKHAFEECKLIPALVLPETTREIGAYGFYNCNSMVSINIPVGVQIINDYTFYGCASLKEMLLPNTVTEIGDWAFYGCVMVENVDLGDQMTRIGQYAFYNCNQIVDLVIPETVRSIENYAFRSCSSIKELYIPNSVTDLGDFVFYGCTGLKQVEFGEGITVIGDRVFYACVSLENVVFNASMDEIHDLAFYGAETANLCAFEDEYVEMYCNDYGMTYYNLNRDFTMILTPPTKLEYNEYEQLDTTGIMLVLNYTNGMERTFETGYIVSGYDPMVLGEQTVTVTYNGQTATFTVNVIAKEVQSVSVVAGVPGQVIVGEGADLSELKILVTFTDGMVIELGDGFAVDGFDPDVIGDQTVTVTYREGVGEFTISVTDYIRGDINGDGIVSVKDVTRLVNYLNDDSIEVINKALDVNGDGLVTIKDVTRLTEYLENDTVEIF